MGTIEKLVNQYGHEFISDFILSAEREGVNLKTESIEVFINYVLDKLAVELKASNRELRNDEFVMKYINSFIKTNF